MIEISHEGELQFENGSPMRVLSTTNTHKTLFSIVHLDQAWTEVIPNNQKVK